MDTPSATRRKAPAPRVERAGGAAGHGRPVACIVSSSFDRDPRARKVVASLAGMGLRVVVIAWDREGRGRTAEAPGDHAVVWLGPRSQPGRGLRQLPALLAFWLGTIRLLLANDFAAYHCNRFDTLLPALLACLGRRRPIVYDLHTSYADRLRIHDRQPGMKLVRGLVAAAEGFAVRRLAAHCFTDSAPFTRELRSRGARSASTLLNVPRLDFGRGARPRQARAAPVVVGRIGAFSAQLGQGADDLFHVLRRNDEEGRPVDLRLLLVGNFVPASYRAEVAARAEDARVTLCDYVPHEAVPAWYARLDVAVIAYDVAGGARYSRLASAQKVFEAMAMGVPMVLLANPYMEALVRRLGCGVVPERRDFEGIYGAVLHLARDGALRERMGRAGRRAFVRRYHWEREEEELARVYRRVLAPEPRGAAAR
ncbi:MAG: glycosyltransferase [Longimicrobiaceae bacterium]